MRKIKASGGLGGVFKCFFEVASPWKFIRPECCIDNCWGIGVRCSRGSIIDPTGICCILFVRLDVFIER